MILRKHSLPIKVAANAFRFVRTDNLPLEEALGKAGVIGQVDSLSKLGTLLVDSKLITLEQYEEAQKTGAATNTPVGRMLSLMGLITPKYSLSSIRASITDKGAKNIERGSSDDPAKSENIRKSRQFPTSTDKRIRHRSRHHGPSL